MKKQTLYSLNEHKFDVNFLYLDVNYNKSTNYYLLVLHCIEHFQCKNGKSTIYLIKYTSKEAAGNGRTMDSYHRDTCKYAGNTLK